MIWMVHVYHGDILDPGETHYPVSERFEDAVLVGKHGTKSEAHRHAVAIESMLTSNGWVMEDTGAFVHPHVRGTRVQIEVTVQEPKGAIDDAMTRVRYWAQVWPELYRPRS
jgi:hypothetical protein